MSHLMLTMPVTRETDPKVCEKQVRVKKSSNNQNSGEVAFAGKIR